MDSKEIGVSAIRSALSAMPFIGGALNEIAFDYRSRVKQRRVEEFLHQVKAKLDDLDATTIRSDYLDSEEFGEFIEAVLIQVSRTFRERKRERLRDLLLRQITAPVDLEYAEVFLDLASELSEKELEVLACFREAADNLAGQVPSPGISTDEKARRMAHVMAESYSIDTASFRFILQHLCARGLLIDDSMNRYSTRPLAVVVITDFGRGFLDFLVGGSSG